MNIGDIVAHLKLDISNFKNNAEKAMDSVGDLGDIAEKSSKGFTVMKGVIADLASNAIQAGIVGMKNFATSMVDTAAEVKASNAQFEQTFGDMKDQATQAMNSISKETGILGTRLQDGMTKMYGFARASGGEVKESLTLAENAMRVAADGAAYYDESLETTTDRLQSFLKGNYENDAALGVSCTEFTRNAKATELFGKKFKDLSEIQKQQTLLKMVEDAQKASGAFGQASRESGAWENVMGNLNEAWRQFKANVGAPVLEALIPIIQDVTKAFKEWSDSVDWEAFGDKVQKAFEIVKEVIETTFGWIVDHKAEIIAVLSGILAGFLAFKTITFITTIVGAFQTLFAVIKSGQIVMTVFNAIMAANPIGLVAIAIGVLVGAFVLLWNKCEGFREFWINLWNEISAFFTEFVNNNKETLNQLKQNFVDIWEGIKLVFSGALDIIKGIFTGDMDLIKQGASTWGEGIKQVFEGAWEAIKNVFSLACEFVKQLFTEWYNTLDSDTQQWIDGILESLTGMWEGLKSMFEGFLQVIKGIWEGDWTAVSEGGKKIWDGIKEWFTNVWQLLKDTVGKYAKALKEEAINKFNELKTQAINKINELKTNAINKFNELKTNAINKLNEMKTNAINKVTEMKNNFVNKITEMKTNAVNKIKEVATGIVNGLKDLPGKLRQAAKDAVQGLINGLNDKLQAVKEKAKEIADKVKEALTNALKIKSPSRVMRDEVGKFIPEGIAVGMDMNADEAINSAKDLAKSLVSSVDLKPLQATVSSTGIRSTTGNTRSNTMSVGEQALLNQLRVMTRLLEDTSDMSGLNVVIEEFNNHTDEDINGLMQRMEAQIRLNNLGKGVR